MILISTLDTYILDSTKYNSSARFTLGKFGVNLTLLYICYMEIPAPAGTSSIRFPRRNSDPERHLCSPPQLTFYHREHDTRRLPPDISGFWRKLKLERTYEFDEKRLYLCHGEFPPNARSRKKYSKDWLGVNLSG